LHPDHVVIGTVRDPQAPKAEELRSLPTASGSRLVLVGIENKSLTDPKKAIETVEADGIDHVDIVIACSGISIGAAPLELADPEAFTESFKVNVLSNLVLFQAVNKLVVKSSAPKWISVSSRGGSTSAPLPWCQWAAAYCMSKAAQNWFSQYVFFMRVKVVKQRAMTNAPRRTLHTANEKLVAFAIHPG
jgi:NAD(P)-dependent dehydrogenase (short-subunit alcohol dehydrogenase family)